MAAERIGLSIRVTPEMHRGLHVAAEERGLSVNFLVNHALEEFMARLIPADELRLTREGQ